MKSKIQQGLEIFTQEFGSWSLQAEHDEIWVYPSEDVEKQEMILSTHADVVEKLKSLGWFHEDGFGWSHYA